MSPRSATFGVFFVNGAAIGVWVAQIPFVKDRFDLANSTLGLILLTMSIGVIVALPIMGQAVVRLGSARAVRLGGTACCLMVPLPLLAPEPYLLPLALLAFGAAGAAMDVSMNAHGSAIEGRLGRPIMSSLHAGWSFGGFAGAACVAAATAAGVDPRLQNTIAAGLLLAALLACLTSLGPGSATAAGERFQLPSRAVVLMAVLCFLTMVTEGAMADWGGVYLRDDLEAAAGVAAAAFAAFAAGMTVGRLTGDWINQQIGPTRLLRGGSALAAIALGTMLVLAHPVAALAGLVLVGIGVANGVPLLFSAAGAGGVETSGPSIAAVSSMGSLGFLVGPPFIGFLADATSLPLALTSLCLATAAVALLAPRIHGRAARPEPELAIR
jgi:predicted MFS family arabinose efflux permease